ncbi:acyl-CoA thioesterase [Conchiformibius kuhniae]|uniref:Acyl-CoA thioesterase n=1 Tax=Conchiformibius kuhniae TaxID=211502 RepID=A0A8T9MWS2_9NEIS|nr:thioesterase family protein [Conchiformibius kuhniae]
MAEHVYLHHETVLTVPFFDVDAMEMAWHGNYVKYFEIARCALLDHIRHNYNDMRETGYTWPIVRLEIKYLRPARFGQQLRVACAVAEYESCLKIRYTIRDAADGTLLTRGFTMQAAVHTATGELQLQTPAAWQRAVRACAGFRGTGAHGQS